MTLPDGERARQQAGAVCYAMREKKRRARVCIALCAVVAPIQQHAFDKMSRARAAACAQANRDEKDMRARICAQPRSETLRRYAPMQKIFIIRASARHLLRVAAAICGALRAAARHSAAAFYSIERMRPGAAAIICRCCHDAATIYIRQPLLSRCSPAAPLFDAAFYAMLMLTRRCRLLTIHVCRRHRAA